MPAFRFIGDDGEGPQSLSLFRHIFDLHGDAVAVEDPNAVRRLRGNRHFEEVEESPGPPGPPDPPAPEGEGDGAPAMGATPRRRGRSPKAKA